MKEINAGIIGCGKVAHVHAAAIQQSEWITFVAVCSRDEKNRQMFSDRYGVNAYVSPEEMVQKSSLDMVIICTPHPVHREPAIAALKAGAHVLVEKPLASGLEDCDLMLAAAREEKKLLGVVSQRRFYPACQRIKKTIDESRIGIPVFGTVNMLGWRDEAYYNSDPWRGKWESEGGGVLVNQAPHQLDLLRWFMGDPEELFGTCRNLNHPYIEVEDTALAIIKFRNGGIGSIIVSNSQKPGIYGKVHVHGSTGSTVGVQTDGGAMFIAGIPATLEPAINDIWTIPGDQEKLAEWTAQDRDLFRSVDPVVHFIKLQDEDFARAIIDGRAPMIDGIQGRTTVEIFTAIYRSNRDNKPVKWPLVPEQKTDFDGRLTTWS